MTAATLSLPFREFEREPNFRNRDEHIAWSVECLVEFWAESGEAWPLGMLRHLRPDLTLDQLAEEAGRLCTLSDTVFGFEMRGESRTGACQVAEREYAEALAALMTKPVQS